MSHITKERLENSGNHASHVHSCALSLSLPLSLSRALDASATLVVDPQLLRVAWLRLARRLHLHHAHRGSVAGGRGWLAAGLRLVDGRDDVAVVPLRVVDVQLFCEGRRGRGESGPAPTRPPGPKFDRSAAHGGLLPLGQASEQTLGGLGGGRGDAAHRRDPRARGQAAAPVRRAARHERLDEQLILNIADCPGGPGPLVAAASDTELWFERRQPPQMVTNTIPN